MSDFLERAQARELARAAAEAPKGPTPCSVVHVVGGESGTGELCLALVLQPAPEKPAAALLLLNAEQADDLAGKLQRGAAAMRAELERRAKLSAAPAAGDGPSCRSCGCTDDDCSHCIELTGEPCSWVEPDLCSACAMFEGGEP